jgi:hypothetical protein
LSIYWDAAGLNLVNSNGTPPSFQKNPRCSPRFMVDTLSWVGHLSHVHSRLVASHKFHIPNRYIVEDGVLRSLKQPPSHLSVFNRDKRMTLMRPSLMGISSKGRRRTLVRRSSFLPTRGGCQCNIPSSKPILMDHCPLLLLSSFG